jgi:hypothetical protein
VVMSAVGWQPRGATVGPIVVVRMNGPAFALVGQLQFRRTAALLQELLHRERALRCDGEALCDGLYTAIGRLEHGRTKGRLVGLRRSIHACRRPSPSELEEEVWAAMSPAVSAATRSWLHAIAVHDRLRKAVEEAFDAECDAKDKTFQSALMDEAFLHGLLVACPELASAVREHEAGIVDRRPWQSSSKQGIRGVKYLSRATTKTSPFSTFTLVGTGCWKTTEDSSAFRLGETNYRTRLELSGWILDTITRKLAHQECSAPHVLVSANPSLLWAEDSIQFIGAGPGEPLLELKLTSAIREAIRLAEPGEITLEQVKSRLCQRSEPSRRALLSDLIDRLIEIGVLQIAIPIRDDPLQDLIRWLRKTEQAPAKHVASQLALINSALDLGSETCNFTVRTRTHALISRRLSSITAQLGISLDSVQQRRALHEDGLLEEPAAEFNPAVWAQPLRDMNTIRKLLGAFDPHLLLRLSMTRLFIGRFGACAEVPFLQFYAAVRNRLSVSATSEETDREVSDFVSGIDRLRRRLMDEAADKANGGISGHVQVDPSVLDEMWRERPSYVPELRSAEFYVQPLMGEADFRLVLNNVMLGHGRAIARLSQLQESAGIVPAIVSRSKRDYYTRSLPFVEASGTFGSSLNQRIRIAEHQLDYPFSANAASDSATVPLSNLTVRHDGSPTLKLFSRELGGEVRPLYLGLVAEGLLPPALRCLILLFGETVGLFHVRQRLFHPRRLDEVSDRVTASPRISIGRVTMERASWVVRTSGVPISEKRERPTAHLLDLTRWLDNNGIPRQCFVRALDPPRPNAIPNPLATEHKPLWVDFENWALILAFHRMIRKKELTIFEESLPDPSDFDRIPNGGRVLEFVIQLDAVSD